MSGCSVLDVVCSSFCRCPCCFALLRRRPLLLRPLLLRPLRRRPLCPLFFSFVSLSACFLEDTGITVLADAIPLEAPPVHRDEYTRGQRLDERQGAPEVEQSV